MATARPIIGLGAVAVSLAALPYKAFDLDRFFVPKELVLHAVAVIAALAVLSSARRLTLTRVDTLLAASLALGALSAALATNRWLGFRSLTILLSGAALFWSAGALRRAGRAPALLPLLALGVVAAAITSLLQTYGVQSELFSLNRIPGGTMGNRNFVAHLCAIGLPTLLLCTLTAASAPGFALGALGVALTSATLVLTRSRAAWLAVAVYALLVALAVWHARIRWRDPRLRRRAMATGSTALVAVVAAILLPNKLEWRSDSPYLDSVTGVVNYREGSGHGRLLQYANSLYLVRTHPLLGVGPGNWAVEYPHVALPDDPSLDHETLMTANPWPSSDWMAFLAERGAPALALLGLALLGLAVTGWRALHDADNVIAAATALTLLATLAAALVVGAFDAVLLLAAPSLLVWALLGALAPLAKSRVTLGLSALSWGTLVAVVATVGLLALARSTGQIAAMALVTDAAPITTLERAARLDPGSYRIQMRVADGWVRRGRCERARPFATRAKGLFPYAPAPRRILAECRAAGRQ